MSDRLPWLWDVDMDGAAFCRILRGEDERPGFDWAWAMVRLIEYAPYRRIREFLPIELFVERWPRIADRIRSPGTREGTDFLHRKLLARRAVR